MYTLSNQKYQNNSFIHISFDGGRLTQHSGVVVFQELLTGLNLRDGISKDSVTKDQRRYCFYPDTEILIQFLLQLLLGYDTDYACRELSSDAYFPIL